MSKIFNFKFLIFNEKRRGFTLVELLVVMAIISVLAMVTWGNFISTQQKGRDATRKADLRQLGAALEAYVNDKGSYPTFDVATVNGFSQGRIVGCGCGSGTGCSWGSAPEFCVSNAVYMKELPNDPLRQASKNYCYWSDGTSYKLYANLENTKDADCTTTNCASTTLCANVGYNFGISSTNTTP